jgi:hypothetical protein
MVEIFDIFERHPLVKGRAQSWCLTHQQMCPLEHIHEVEPQSEENKVYRVSISGTLCIAMSSRGSQMGFIHHSAGTLAAYMMLRLFLEEDVAIHECTVLSMMIVRLLRKVLGHIYIIQTLRINPLDLGDPAARPRRYTLMLHRRCALQTSFDWSMESMKRFERTRTVTCDIFWSAPDALVLEWYMEKAKRQLMHEHIEAYKVGKMTLLDFCDSVMDGGESGRLALQRAYGNAFGYMDPVCDPSANLHMNLFSAKTCSEILPTLTTKTMPWKRGRYLLPREKLASLGVCAWPSLAWPGFRPIVDIDALSSGAIRDAAGNGMSVGVCLSVALWGLGSIVDPLSTGLPLVPRALESDADMAFSDESDDE